MVTVLKKIFFFSAESNFNTLSRKGWLSIGNNFTIDHKLISKEKFDLFGNYDYQTKSFDEQAKVFSEKE